MQSKEILNNKLYKYTEGLTFDDVLIVPGYAEIVPAQAVTDSMLTRNIKLKIPIVSAAMDTVTDANLAIAIAQVGGIGIIHRNFTAEKQAEEVKKVKRFENIIISNPIVLTPDKTIADVREVMNKYKISGIPIVGENNILIGIVTRRDLDFIESENPNATKIESIMTPKNELITYKGNVDLKTASRIMRENRVEKLPIVDDNFRLKGLITLKDITKIVEFPNATKDAKGRLMVGAAVGTKKSELDRIKLLVEANVDVIVVDTAHGHSLNIVEMIKNIKKTFPNIDVIAGNIATSEAAEMLIKAGADGIKVGIGPGSICTTRVVAGIGVPQISAIIDVVSIAEKHKVPIIADGGIKFSGDVSKAIAAGADTVMIGNLFAGTTESPGEFVIFKGRRYKSYRGMGSLGAMVEGSKSRYNQDDYELEKLVPEGIEGRVPYKGDLKDVIYQLVGGLKASMGYCGSKDIETFKKTTKFIKISHASLKESHPHDIIITREAPNYMVDSNNE